MQRHAETQGFSVVQQYVGHGIGRTMHENPQVANYDPQHRLIRSMFNGSRGPLLRKATATPGAYPRRAGVPSRRPM